MYERHRITYHSHIDDMQVHPTHMLMAYEYIAVTYEYIRMIYG